jgi:hypothetical protein
LAGLVQRHRFVRFDLNEQLLVFPSAPSPGQQARISRRRRLVATPCKVAMLLSSNAAFWTLCTSKTPMISSRTRSGRAASERVSGKSGLSK